MGHRNQLEQGTSSKKVKIETLDVYGRKPIGAVRILGNESNGVKFLKDDPYYFKQDGKQK